MNYVQRIDFDGVKAVAGQPPARSDGWSDWHDDVTYCAENIDLRSERERDFLR